MPEHDTSILPPNPNKGKSKTARIPVKVQPRAKPLAKPGWIRATAPNRPEVLRVRELLRQHELNSVCEEAACPNIGECFSHGTATFMIMGKLCTRRCPFCDVAHGRPEPLDQNEPENLARAISAMQLKYVVITSVDRDDLRDGGAQHFVDCINAVRRHSPQTEVEILVPDFRGRLDTALEAFTDTTPGVFNHNLETIPRLYRQARPGADYQHSLRLLDVFKQRHPDTPTKSGLMVGLGESNEEVEAVMHDLRAHRCDRLTVGQYLQPGPHHLSVERYVTPDEFETFASLGKKMGFQHVASGPMVRSSYHADLQASGEVVR
ncbi:MAG: lipoyl synthase [Acidiferrobacterales bacterium]